MYQKTDEERVSSMRQILLTYFEKENDLALARGAKVETRIEAINKISKETEIQKIIQDFGVKEKTVEDILFKKVASKSDAILQKYDAHYSKSGPSSLFNFEGARQSVSSGIDEGVDEKTREVTATFTKLLSHCWESKILTAQDKDKFRECIKEKKARKIFSECLNQYRKQGIFSMTAKAYSSVAELLYLAIGQLLREEDINFALSIIILSQTYYTDQKTPEGNIEKVYLQQEILRHEYWRKEEFWTKVLDVPLNAETEGTEQGSETEEEKKFREENEIFVKLGTHAHNMLLFEINRKTVEKLIFNYAIAKGLSKQYMDSIQVSIFRIKHSKRSKLLRMTLRSQLHRARSYSLGSRMFSLLLKYQ